MTQPKILDMNGKEYKNLMAVAKMLEAVSKNGYRYIVEDIYFDYGQDWMYTAVITINPMKEGLLSRWQTLNSKQWEMVVESEDIYDLMRAIENIRADEYFKD